MNCYHTNFAALFIQVVNCFFYYLAAGTHSYDNVSSIRSTMVVEQLIVTAGNFVDFSHVVFYYVRNFKVEWVGSFAMLEVNIRVFSSTASYRRIRIQSAFAEFFNCFHIY